MYFFYIIFHSLSLKHFFVKKLSLFASLLLLIASGSFAQVLKTSGNWSNPSIWSPAGVPALNDNVRIAAEHTVTLQETADSPEQVAVSPTSIVTKPIPAQPPSVPEPHLVSDSTQLQVISAVPTSLTMVN